MNRILLLHPDDAFTPRLGADWSLIVDLARAPVSLYEEWSRRAGCPVMTLFDFAAGTDDLHRTRELLEHGMGRVVDRFGIDWWDVLVQSVVPQLQQLICLARLGEGIEQGTNIYCTRPHFLAKALQRHSGGKLAILESAGLRLRRTASHYVETVGRLDFTQLTQIIQDKFDPEHAIRRHLARSLRPSATPLVLLPSAYVNVSRTAVAFAGIVPDVQFLLLHARNSGRLAALPANVRQASLDGYFSAVDRDEQTVLSDVLTLLCRELACAAPELGLAQASGLLTSVQARLKWGLAVRDAWLRVFDSQRIAACICADDSNPYSRIPLILAKRRGLPVLACHHGAFDSRMAIKKPHADFYVAKSEMERDYLVRVCRVAEHHIVTAAPTCSINARVTPSSADWLVFFTEPYHALGWRTDEVYRELLPGLVTLARECGRELVFKLHPFESSAGHKKILHRLLGRDTAEKIRIITGPISPELWKRTGCALTVQSTVALECSSRGVPVFLCDWLADGSCGYVEQFQRFGSGRILRSVAEFQRVPEWMHSPEFVNSRMRQSEPLDSEILRQLLGGTYSRQALATA
jgi:hypothetical protein